MSARDGEGAVPDEAVCRHLWSAPDANGVRWCLWCDSKTGREALSHIGHAMSAPPEAP